MLGTSETIGSWIPANPRILGSPSPSRKTTSIPNVPKLARNTQKAARESPHRIPMAMIIWKSSPCTAKSRKPLRHATYCFSTVASSPSTTRPMSVLQMAGIRVFFHGFPSLIISEAIPSSLPTETATTTFSLLMTFEIYIFKFLDMTDSSQIFNE